MSKKSLLEIIDYLMAECTTLKNKHVGEKDLEADYVCIFSRTEKEYNELLNCAKSFGRIVDETPTGPVFSFSTPQKTTVEKPKVLKIRKPDTTRPQRGDVDFNTDYPRFKEKYLNNREFTLIKRETFEMIELKDDSFNVLVYFSSIPPSKQLGID